MRLIYFRKELFLSVVVGLCCSDSGAGDGYGYVSDTGIAQNFVRFSISLKDWSVIPMFEYVSDTDVRHGYFRENEKFKQYRSVGTV